MLRLRDRGRSVKREVPKQISRMLKIKCSKRNCEKNKNYGPKMDNFIME